MPTPLRYQYLDIDGIRVYRTALNEQTILYNLRLPDGSGNGEGYPRTQHTSLTKLNTHHVQTIKTIDQGVVYDLGRLYHVLTRVINIEADQASDLEFNLTESNPALNGGDHADHLATSDIMQAVISQLDGGRCIRENKYSTYINRYKPISMSALSYQQHIAMWHVLNDTLVDYRYHSVLDAGHLGWLGRQYVTTQFSTGVCMSSSLVDLLSGPIAPIDIDPTTTNLLNAVHDASQSSIK
jgi:hypothetical protein